MTDHTSIKRFEPDRDHVRITFHARNRDQAWQAVTYMELHPIKGYTLIWHHMRRRPRGGQLRILEVGFYPTGALLPPDFDPTSEEHWRWALKEVDQIAGTPRESR